MILYPKLSKATLEDISQTSYLGAIPITIDTIIVGMTLFYSERTAAIWAAYGLFWVATAMSVWLGCAIVFIACDQKPHDLEDVTGVYGHKSPLDLAMLTRKTAGYLVSFH